MTPALELLSPADAAKILGLSADMVRVLAREGHLPTAARSVRGVRLLRREDVEELAAVRAGRFVHQHAVQFYECDDFLVKTMAQFVGEGLRAGAPVIVIVTAAHRLGLTSMIESDIHAGQLTVLDAHDTLDRLLCDGRPD